MADRSSYPDSDENTVVEQESGSPPKTPGWVKLFALTFLIVILLVIIAMFLGIGGEHGPGRHMRSGSAVDPLLLVQQSM